MNMQALMQQAQKMQREMEKAQKDLEAKVFEIVSAGGGIKVTITGAKVVKNIEIDEDIIDPEEKEMLQDMIVVAINEAINKVINEEQKIVAKQQANMRMPF
jgi:DNA-binding YbaB/EbfC family protein